MSVAIARSALERFLASPEPEVLCIRGAWGVGKTFAFRQIVESQSAAKNISLERYAYVSLFGLDSLDKVRQAIFDNTIKTNEVVKKQDGSSIFERFSDLEAMARKAKGLQAFLPGNLGRSGAAAIVERVTFAFSRKQIVCFDDLERASSKVSVRDILGLSTFLKEERGCKVVLILNDEKLDDSNKDDFEKQFEKVVDRSIYYDPSPRENLDVALGEKFEEEDYFRDLVVSLDIRNIRIMTKIKRAVEDIQKECGLTGWDLKQVMAASALAGWIKYEAGDRASLSSLKKYNSLLVQMRSQRDDAEPIPEWASKAEAIGYTLSDNRDCVVIDAIDHGYVNFEAFEAAKLEDDREASKAKRNEEFSEAWGVYHGSLDKSDGEIVGLLLRAMRKDYQSIDLLNFNGTVMLFRELGFDKQADAAITEYFDSHEFDRFALRNDLSVWGSERIDPSIERHFDKLIAEYVDERDPLTVLLEIASRQGWSQPDIALLTKIGSDGLVEVLDKVPGDRLSSVLKFLSRFLNSDAPEYDGFGNQIVAAFEVLSGRSSNNMRKLRAVGFNPKVEETEP